MTTKKDAKNTLNLKAKTQADKTKRLNELAVSANILNASLAEPFFKDIVTDVTLMHIVNGAKQQIAEVQAGDMTSIEAMLVAQANSLQTMFVSLGRKATTQSGLAQYTSMFNLALKAQAQSRATIQALIELKYPKQATFVKQANISNGNQQVNNGQTNNETSTRAPAHAQVIEQAHNELLNDLNKSERNYATVDNARTTTTS